jgi:glycosyltransferase involved in cell wall biosynthesis
MSHLTFSIVIPTFKRPHKLRNCLEAITKLAYPPDLFEVIVVDDGGGVDVGELFSLFGHRINLVVLHQPHFGPARARNFGAQRAKHNFLAFIDDDCEPDVNWLKNLSAQFNSTPEYLLGGQTVNALKVNVFSTASQLLVEYLYEYAAEINPKFIFFTGNNLSLARNGFFSIGGFDKSFPIAAGEDRDFCSRWSERKGESLFLSSAVVRHYHALNLKSFWQQHFNYGKGSYHFRKNRAQRLDETVKVEPFSFYLKMFLFPFYKTSVRQAFLMPFLFFIAQCANTLGFWSGSLNYSKNALKHERKLNLKNL